MPTADRETSPSSAAPACAIVVAAGRGTRMSPDGKGLRKPLLELAGRPLIEWTLAAFEQAAGVRAGVVVAHADDLETMQSLVASRPLEWHVVSGGEERSDSVRRGVDAAPSGTELVSVHDAARPLIRARDIERVHARAAETGAALLAVPVSDTLKSSSDGGQAADATVDRSHLWAAQTPQVFRIELLRKLLERAAAEGWRPTDEAALHERFVGPIAIVPGNASNLKVTTPADRVLAAALLVAER